MKKFTVFFLLILLMGCAYGKEKLQGYIDDPKSILRDPHYAAYQGKLDKLEQQYLNKEISYSQYLEKKKELDDQYTKDVRERTAIIHNSPTENP